MRPELLKPFEGHNRRHPDYAVRPHTFVSVAYPRLFARQEAGKLFAPYVEDASLGLDVTWYELRSGERVRITTAERLGSVIEELLPVKLYGDVAREHVAHPERSPSGQPGRGARGGTLGALRRWRLFAEHADYVGKESTLLMRRAEGPNVALEAQQAYLDCEELLQCILPRLRRLPSAAVAQAAGVSSPSRYRRRAKPPPAEHGAAPRPSGPPVLRRLRQ